ncbi:MAG: cation:proton antiporter, partial [Myxococcota bacterium]
ALVLFTDAADADLGVLRGSLRIPRRLLLAGLPLTILLGFAAAALLLPGLSVLEALVLATMLAPTDAALGAAVVTNPAVPARIREALNVESGLNDGICVPFLFTFLAVAVGLGDGETTASVAIRLLVEEIGIGLAAGLGCTLLGGWILRTCARRDWVSDAWVPLTVVSLALLCFASAQVAGGSGFIACFVGGMAFGALVPRHKERLLAGAEGSGKALALVTWVSFGAAAVVPQLSSIDVPILVYALLSLTVVRMLPVFLSLAGLGLPLRESLFIGWFGPRGLASIVFAVVVAGEDLPGSATLSAVVVCTVVLSILLHGASAEPLAARYGREA